MAVLIRPIYSDGKTIFMIEKPYSNKKSPNHNHHKSQDSIYVIWIHDNHQNSKTLILKSPNIINPNLVN